MDLDANARPDGCADRGCVPRHPATMGRSVKSASRPQLRRLAAAAAVLAAAVVAFACDAGEPAPAPTATAPPAPAPTPTALPPVTPIPTQFPRPAGAAARTTPRSTPSPPASPIADLDIAVDSSTSWSDLFSTLDAAEQSCLREGFGSTLTMALAQPILREGQAEDWEVTVFSCLTPGTARAVFLAGSIARAEEDDVELGEDELTCLRETVAGADVASVVAAERDGDPAVGEFLAAFIACLPPAPAPGAGMTSFDQPLPRATLTSSQRVVFVGELSPERRDELRAAVEYVVAYFGDRYGIVPPEFTVYISPDAQAANDLFHEITGVRLQGRSHVLVAGGTPDTGLFAFVAGPIVHRRDGELENSLAHEYYHILQRSILGMPTTLLSPGWIVEGSAEYNGELYREYRTGFRPDPTIRLLAMRDEESYAGLEGYEAVALLFDWVVRQSGKPDSHIEYWQLVADHRDWRAAFESAFGLAVDEYLEAFESYRSDLASASPAIRGRVVDLSGNALPGVHLTARFAERDRRPHPSDVTDADGSFEILVPAGTYSIVLGRAVPASTAAADRSVFFDLNVDPDTGYGNVCAIHHIAVGGPGVAGLTVRIPPELLARAQAPPCNEGADGHYLIEATLFGPDGQIVGEGSGMSGPTHYFHVRSVRSGFVQPGLRTGADGRMRLWVPDDLYMLEIVEYSDGAGTRLIGWYGGEAGFTTDRLQAMAVAVDGADVTGIEVHLPADPRDLATIE